MSERSKRDKPAKNRAKLDTLKWNRISNTFRSFKTSLEGHLVQVGAGYMIRPMFIETYKEEGIEYLTSKEFWALHRVSMAQTLHDKVYLYKVLLTATSLIQHKTISKYQHSLDGIKAWHELKEEFEYDRSKEMRIEQLEMLIQTPCSSTKTMARFIDKFQSYMAEIEATSLDEYLNARKKWLLLSSMKTALGVFTFDSKVQRSTSMTYEDTARYLRSNSILINNHNSIRPPSRLMKIEDVSVRESKPQKTTEQVVKLFHTMAKQHGYQNTYNMFNTKTFRDSLMIPSAIWAELEPDIREKINEARKRAREKRGFSRPKEESLAKHPKKQSMDIPNWYTNVKAKTTMAYLISSMSAISLGDIESDSTDDEMMEHSMNMVRRTVPLDPPSDVIGVKAHFEYIDSNFCDGKIYAISDGGANSCILGLKAKIISHTGRFVSLVGYDPNTTRTERVPIARALIKVMPSIGEIPVLLEINETPYIPTSQITLISEYQVREYGSIIDSVAKKHFSAPNVRGKQSFQVNDVVSIDFEDRGGPIEFEILPFEDDDKERWEVIRVTSPKIWIPHRYKKDNKVEQSYDPTNLAQDQVLQAYPASLNHIARYKSDADSEENFKLSSDSSSPIADSQICASATWHRVIY